MNPAAIVCILDGVGDRPSDIRSAYLAAIVDTAVPSHKFDTALINRSAEPSHPATW
jgi:hypothetical protein